MALNRSLQPTRSLRLGAATVFVAVGAMTLAAPGVGHAEPADAPAAAADFPSNVPPGYELAWAEEFGGVNADGTGLDESEWFYREGEKAVCSNQPDNVSVGDGLLHIAIRAEQAEGEDYTCGGVVSKRWFGYGYYETRAKLWGDQGFHSAFWTTGLSAYIPDVPDYRGPHNRINEIDGFEVDSHAPDKLAYHSHWFVPEHVGNQGSLVTQADSSAEYHNYGFEWTPTEVRFYTDGVLMRTLPKAGPHGIQNIWLTTLGYTSPVDETNLPGETTWDHFRYFAPIESGADAAAAQVVVDNGDPGYVEHGAWAPELTDDRRVAFGFQDKEVRRSDDPGATASWKPKLRAAGSYEVYVWNANVLQTGHSAARYTVQHDGGSTDVVIDQRKAGQQWVSLGAFELTPDSGQRVTMAGDAAGAGVLRADAVKFVPAIVVDNGQPGYTESGAWSGSASITGWRGGDTRYASASSAKARWTPELTDAGTYDVYAWIPPRDANSAAASYTVVSADGTHEVAVDASTPTGEWLRLGNFAFDAGTAGHVELGKKFGVVGLLRADAVKFIAADAEAGAPSVPEGLEVEVERTPPTGDAWFTAEWERVADADVVGYHVYLDGQRLTWQPVQRDTFDFHELLGGETYAIQVSAVDRLGNESALSSPVDAVTPADTRAPRAPTGLVGEAANGEAVLYWDQSPELDLGGYNVYADGRLITPEPFGNTNDRHNRDLGFEVPGLENGVAHTLEVAAVDFVGNESDRSAVSVTPLPMSIIGVEDAGYTEVGAWAPSSVAGWLATKTRTSNLRAASAEWRPDLATAGTYDVYAWVPNNANSTPVARYTIASASGTTVTELDQRSGGSKWVLLGTAQFDAGTAGAVTITNGASGYLRTNAVKFVPTGG
ncbi:golvesin C-terminal-like domain-containing protein [Agromyces ramosus]|uniref:Beta-glucanase (GH16 family) n=1 Tax=Agromyces ramosus TaxID=33879 RepID=A0ABU0R8R0_9MICO|nr:family 16 glycosylhydrolase [Agromyces ramosus]MDQ0894142.1 hypothetical protein [Agromyces ramosus]